MYGITANIRYGIKLFNSGSKVWIVSGWTGGCYERIRILGRACNKRWIIKWIAIKELHKMRVAWIPNHIREKHMYELYGTKEEMQSKVDFLNTSNNIIQHPKYDEYEHDLNK